MICWTSILRWIHLWLCNINEFCYQAELSSSPFICTRYFRSRIQKNFIEANWLAEIWLSNTINFHMSDTNCKDDLKICCFALNFERRAKHVIVSVVSQQRQMTYLHFFFYPISQPVAIFELASSYYFQEYVFSA